MNDRAGYGYIERRITAALAPGPLSISVLTTTIYGSAEHSERCALRESVARLRKRCIPIARAIRYTWIGGDLDDDAGKMTMRAYDMLRTKPSTITELAQALYGTDDRSRRLRVQEMIYLMRRRGVIIETESIYFLKEKGNTP